MCECDKKFEKWGVKYVEDRRRHPCRFACEPMAAACESVASSRDCIPKALLGRGQCQLQRT
jgi:hypothetical protein